jgi:hypothetical protein
MLAAPAKEVGMGWLDKLLGRGEEAADKAQDVGGQAVDEVKEHMPGDKEDTPEDRPVTGSDAPGPGTGRDAPGPGTGSDAPGPPG